MSADNSGDHRIRVSNDDGVYDEAARTDLVTRGIANEARFSWTRCASETLAFYRTLLAR